MTMRSREEVENAMEYYIKMFDKVQQMQYCSHTFEELKTYYTKQINKCLEELNGK